MLETFFSNPGSMTTEQWLALCILGFIVLAILVLIHRLLAIMKMSRRQTYRPNLRRLRGSRLLSAENADQEQNNAK